MTDQGTTEALPATPGPDPAGTGLTLVGVVLVIVGIFGAVILFSEMGDSGFGDFEYSTVDKWLAVLAATTVVALGCIVAALGSVVSELAKRR